MHSFFTTPKTCFKSLFATAITASFLFFHLATSLSNNSSPMLVLRNPPETQLLNQ